MTPLLVTAAVIIEEGRVLLTQRPEGGRHAGYWEFPGGKLEAGENPTEALQRELQEELGIQIEVGVILEAAYYRYDWGPVLILAYHCRIVDGTPQNLEVAAHRWVELSGLDDYTILPADTPIVSRLTATTSC